jgi:ribonuclease T2
MVQAIVRAAAAFYLLAVAVDAASAQGVQADRPRGQPGQFDFYVLSLSWSPSFCAAAAERGRFPPQSECGMHSYGFIVHGLWPQYENGFPQFCQLPAPRLDRHIVSSMLDLMPAPGLVYGEWDRHGTCTGLSARDYFDTVRSARTAVKIPPQFVALTVPLTVSPADVEDAFISANPDLARGDMAVDCETARLAEVRLCLTKDLKFRTCPQIVAHSCRRGELLMPPPGGADPSGR